MLLALISYATIFLVLLQSPTVPGSKGTDKPQLLCSVSGRIVSAAEGTPLKSARVVLMPEHRDESRDAQVYSATSDSDGRFTIKDIPAGRYEFFAVHNGYVDQRYQSKGTGEGAILALRVGQNVEDILFRMVLAAVITGRISDEDGEAMANIHVVALQRPDEDEVEDRWTRKRELQPVAAAQTDDRGQFRIFGLKPGEYYVRAADEFIPPMIAAPEADQWAMRESLGSQYAPVYYPGVTQMGQAQAIAVTAGEESQVDFIMRRARMIEISGRVISPNGKACTNCYVTLDEVQGSGFGVGHQTDKDGNFKIRGVAPGSYTLMAEEESATDSERYRARQKIEAGSDNIDSIILALGRGTRITGRVISAGTGSINLERLFVFLSSSDAEEQPGGWGAIKKDGSFSLLDVPDGSFWLDVSGLETNWYVKSARIGSQDIFSDGVQVEKGQAAGAIEITVSNLGARLDGTVTEDEKPVAGVRVRLTPDPETPYNRRRTKAGNTDQGGRFAFSGIAPGHYRLIAKIPGVEGAKPLTSEAKEVTLAEREHKAVDLAIVPPPNP